MSAAASTCSMASDTRDSSPPDAMRASGRAGSPALGASRNVHLVRPGRVQLGGREHHAEGGLGEAQVPQDGRDGTRDRRPAAARRAVRQHRRRVLGRGAQPLVGSRALGAFRVESLQASDLVRRRPPRAPAPPPRSAVLAQQAVQQRPAAPPAAVAEPRSASRPSAARRTSSAMSTASASRPSRRIDQRLEPRIGPGQVAGVVERPGGLVLDAAPLAHQARADGVREADRPLGAREHASRARSSSTSPGRGSTAATSSTTCRASARRRSISSGDISSAARASRLARHSADAGRDRGTRRCVAAEGVEQVALPGGRQQPLLIVLAVDRDERLDHGRQACRGHRLVVDARDGASGRGQLAHADERLAGVAVHDSGGRTAPPPARPRRRSARATMSARPPLTRASASMTSDLPAPVSPVMTVSPAPSCTRTRSMSARSVTDSSSSAMSGRQQLGLASQQLPEREGAARLDEPDGLGTSAHPHLVALAATGCRPGRRC